MIESCREHGNCIQIFENNRVKNSFYPQGELIGYNSQIIVCKMSSNQIYSYNENGQIIGQFYAPAYVNITNINSNGLIIGYNTNSGRNVYYDKDGRTIN